MGQVIRLPARPPTYPDRSADLDPAECVLLIAIRWWVADHLGGADPLPRLCEALETAGAHDAAFSVDRLMAVIARSVCRPMAVHCPRCPQVSEDEKRLLHAASLAQASNTSRAERVLRHALLSAQGAEFALGPLEGIGELFAAARLFLRKRSLPADHGFAAAAIEPWLPSGPPESLH